MPSVDTMLSQSASAPTTLDVASLAVLLPPLLPLPLNPLPAPKPQLLPPPAVTTTTTMVVVVVEAEAEVAPAVTATAPAALAVAPLAALRVALRVVQADQAKLAWPGLTATTLLSASGKLTKLLGKLSCVIFFEFH